MLSFAAKWVYFSLQPMFVLYRITAGVSGDVAINSKGNRVPVFVFSNRQHGGWIPIVEIDQTKPINESVKLYNSSTVWPGGTTTVPLDEPKCGFHGEKCVSPTGKRIANNCRCHF